MMTDLDVVTESPAEPVALRRVLVSVIVVALLVLAGTAGWLLRGSPSTSVATPGVNSVDAGFARDMATHHTQAVIMAGYERDNTDNAALRVLATDMETSQNQQIGEMQGWLDVWGLARASKNQMAWMGPGMGMGPTALMPGMATPAEMDHLQTLHGKALDIDFLQLMIRHHQGGLEMAQYAVQHASEPYVRDMAESMLNSQNSEIIEMEQILRTLGGHPLAPPA